ncbi:PREDICTED: sodium- and chloride-dependent transporter XTRP3A-like [Chinchilla lanigera]|uniref:sodium- and chloride-dependent transporter XTRP3A-like n=1 Tax=Chinchilla lanigera TaxID=34839 RepID=UPI0006967313|nr:PREDICTED: sodium- and chloride-dependent transporter XTRP3A-like [Chinchilla lanigera]
MRPQSGPRGRDGGHGRDTGRADSGLSTQKSRERHRGCQGAEERPGDHPPAEPLQGMEPPSAHLASLAKNEELQPWGSQGCPALCPERRGGAEDIGSGAQEKARTQWDHPLQFIFTCISYAVGLGNVWRFPYLCQMYGGGSFLIPYFIMLIVEGMPLLYLELAVGQRMRQGSIGAWRTISPYLGGVGMASMMVSFFLSLYYNVVNTWGFWYLFHSFQDPLPWSVCPLNGNRTGYEEECEKASSTQYFWYRKTLNISPSIQDSGAVQWEPALCLILAWMMMYLFTLRNTETVGKVGSARGGLHGTGWHPAEWGPRRCCWSKSPTVGEEVAGSSCGCSVHSFISSSVHANRTWGWSGQAVQGTGLAFIVYTEAIKNMEVSQLWSVLYFFMLLMLGVGSMLGNTVGILTPLTDSEVISSHLPKEAISGLLCLVNCAVGLLFTMEAGSYWFDIFNDYAATLSLLLIVLVETLAVCYVYGLRSPLLIVGLFLFYLSDYILSGTLQYQAWDATQGRLVTKDYPTYALAVIGLLVASSTMCIPLVALGTFVIRRLRKGGRASVA